MSPNRAKTNRAKSSAYDRLAAVYDALGKVYSADGIARSKLAHLELLIPGERVLYLGAGTGEECVEAARLGARVTVAEPSKSMLLRCRRRFDEAGLGAELLPVRLEELPSQANYDVIVAPYFLNVFSPSEVLAHCSRIEGMLTEGGRFIIVDFRAPSTGFFALLQRCYYLPPLALFWIVAENAWHELYDYASLLSPQGWVESRRIIHKAWGMSLLETLVLVRSAATSGPAGPCTTSSSGAS